MTTAIHALVISQDVSILTWAFPIIHRTKEKTTFALIALYSLSIAPDIPWQNYWCIHGWAKSLKDTRALSASMQHSVSKLRQRTNLPWQQFWLTGGCFHILQNRVPKRRSQPGLGPAGSEVYFNGVCSLSLAVSAMYQFCKFRCEGWEAFFLLPENTSSHPSLSWECPPTFIQV